MSFKTIPIKIPSSKPITNYIISSSCPNDKLTTMMNIIKLRDAPYHNKSQEDISKSAPACILSEYMSAYISDSNSDSDDLVYSLDGSDLELDEKKLSSQQEHIEIFDGDFTKDNPIVRKMFEDAAKYLIEQDESLEINHRDTPIV